jgi:hypothetical protein
MFEWCSRWQENVAAVQGFQVVPDVRRRSAPKARLASQFSVLGLVARTFLDMDQSMFKKTMNLLPTLLRPCAPSETLI